MSTWVWGVILLAVLVAVGLIAWLMTSRRRTQQLRARFGPEYERAVNERDSKRHAESELEARRARRDRLDIRPLAAGADRRYATSWQAVQSRFLDAPTQALAEADVLVAQLMRERG